MTQSALLRLKRVAVDDLFGLYNHCIDLNLDDRVTLLHGPNGVGKTVILIMIDRLLSDRLWYFQSIPFSRFELTFDDDSILGINVTKMTDSAKKYTLTLVRNGETYSSEIDWNRQVEAIAEQTGVLHPIDTKSSKWRDIRDGEILSSKEIISRYSKLSHEHVSGHAIESPWFGDFLKSAKGHLIEAQRLLRIDWEAEPNLRRRWHVQAPSMISTVVECSQDYRKRLGDAMAHYGRQSQELDQSFPQRLISATNELAVIDLQQEMTVLDQKTDELKAIGILEKTPSHPFDIASLGHIDETRARVMTLYVDDTAKKLQALDSLADRTRIFLGNVNQKFRHKKIRLDQDQGFVAESEIGNILPLDSLSSGEQQELVLNYYLLFRVPSNTIVLIDEPELSLHVAWQRRFLSDLLAIIKLSDFDALIATHSPYIVSTRDDLMVGLGDA